MYRKNKLIDSETLKKLEQEIYHKVINSSNNNEVLFRLKELKNLSVDELRDKMPWNLIKREIGLKQIVFSWITDSFVKIKLKITRNKNVVNNNSLVFSKINPEKAYNLTYKYYLKPIFDNINSDIEDALDKYKIKYVYIYPHEGVLEESGQEFDIYSSKETKRLETQEKILGLFRAAIWVITFGGFFKVININIDIDLWIKIIMGLSVCISVNVLYNICRYYVKVCRQISAYKDKMVVETQKIINSELQPETATDLILDKFYSMVVKRIKEKDTTSNKYFKIAAIALTIILVIVSLYQSFINKERSPLTPSQTITAIPSDEPNSPTPSEKPKLRIEDVEKYLRAKGVIPLLSKEPMPEEEIKFVEEEITGKISSITIYLNLDCNSIKVIAIDDEENIKIEATITPKINVNGWEIIKGRWFSNENKTLKEKYKDGLYDEVLAIYQSKENFISTYNEIKTRAENVAQDKIYDIIKVRYPEVSKIDEMRIYYQPIKIDMSSTDLK
jgi:hypothetical protein